MTPSGPPRPGRFPPMDMGGRLGRVRAAVAGAGCDALLVTNLANVRYLTGFTGSAALVLVGPEQLLLATDGRYGVQAGEQLATAGVEATIAVGSHADQRAALVSAAEGARQLALEAASVSWARQRELAVDWFPRVTLVATEGLVEELRRVKDAGEIARIQEAARMADEALARVRRRLVAGVTEAEVALALDVEMRRLGADGSAFDTIVASGPNGARPHARPSARPIATGELVVIDFGAAVDGYRSDMTRTLCLAPPASATQLRMVDVVTASQRAGVEAVAAGRPAADVDRACRAVIAEAGWADAFLHGTGHGVGLDIHEAPALAATSGDTLAAGHVVTVEPGVYLPAHGGVRIEDTVVVTDDGCLPLTHAPKESVVS